MKANSALHLRADMDRGSHSACHFMDEPHRSVLDGVASVREHLLHFRVQVARVDVARHSDGRGSQNGLKHVVWVFASQEHPFPEHSPAKQSASSQQASPKLPVEQMPKGGAMQRPDLHIEFHMQNSPSLLAGTDQRPRACWRPRRPPAAAALEAAHAMRTRAKHPWIFIVCLLFFVVFCCCCVYHPHRVGQLLHLDQKRLGARLLTT